jgi:hypothetical protein
MKMEKTRGNRKYQEIITFQFFIPGYQKLSWSKVVIDFQIIVEARSCICVNHFLIVKICQTGSVTHKKGAGRLIVRTEEIVNNLRQRIEQDPTKHMK